MNKGELMEKKRLIINLTANIISYSSTILISFLLTPYLIAKLGKEVYGFYPLANNFINYISIISIALNSMASRFITIEITKRNYKKANIYFSSIFFANIILTIILLILMSILVFFLDRILTIPIDKVLTIKILFLLSFLAMLINMITSIFGVAAFAKDRIDLSSIGEIIKGISRILLYIILFNFLKPNIIYVGIVAIFIEIINFIINYNITKKLLPNIKIKGKYFKIDTVKEVLVAGIWNSINQLGGNLLYGMDLVIGNIFFGESIGAELALAHTVPQLVNGVISMLTSVFMPRITHRYALGDIKGLVNEVKISQRIMGLITNVPICMFIIFGQEFFDLWVPGSDSKKLQVLSIMTISHLILVGVVWPISNLNIVMNRVKIPSIIMIVNGIINIISIIALLKFGVGGVYVIPITTMFISFIWFGIFIPIYPCKSLGVKPITFYPAIIRTVVSVPIILLVSNTIKNLFIIDSWIVLIILGIICGIISIIINGLIIFNPLEIKKFIITVFKNRKKI